MCGLERDQSFFWAKRQISYKPFSLAGTLPNKPESEWSNKEIVEQELVTDYMKEVLAGTGIEEYKTNGPYTVEAGQVKHLRTDFSFTTDEVKGGNSRFTNEIASNT